MNVAALDCGTNSTRILVADEKGRTVERLLTITRLGKGVDATGKLDAEAIERTASALREYREVMDRNGVVKARLAATSAVRDAANSEDFVNAAIDACGVEPEILSGDEEGRLSFLGATSSFTAGSLCLALDIGGGSTEFVVGRAGRDPYRSRSMDMGCVRITERFFATDPPTPSEREDAIAEVSKLAASAFSEMQDGLSGSGYEDADVKVSDCLLLGLAGTVTTLKRLSEGWADYDPERLHHSLLELSEVERLLDKLAAVPTDERMRQYSIEAGRADVIVAGATVLSTVMRVGGFQDCTVSETDILNGLALTLL